MKYIFYGLGVLILFIGFAWGMGWFGVLYTETVGAAQQDASRQVFEHTQSYVEGKRQELIKYRLEYMRADSSDKEAIKTMLVHSFSNFDEELLEPELQSFLKEIKY